MNVMFRLRKDMPIVGFIPLKYLIYSALLSDVTPYFDKDDAIKYGVSTKTIPDLYDHYSDLDEDEVYKALNELGDEGLIWFDEEDRIYLGEFRGKKFFPFEVKSSMFDVAKKLFSDRLSEYGGSRSAKDKSRARYIREQMERLYEKGVDRFNSTDFTEIHGFLYEIYTGGEIYSIRNKVEYYQPSNMLKAYDRHTVFALLVEGTLNYDKYRKRGVPTLTNVAVMKDDVFHGLVHSEDGSKEYMRDCDESSEF